MITSIFKQRELRNRILFTMLLCLVYVLMRHIPIVGINLSEYAKDIDQGKPIELLMINLLGGDMSTFSLAALGVMPYITAAIIMQLFSSLGSRRHNEEDRRRVTQQTRYLTLVFALVQSVSLYLNFSQYPVIAAIPALPSQITTLLLILTPTLGCLLLMWLGEQITEHGIGNGIALIIALGIVLHLPSAFATYVELSLTGEGPSFILIIIVSIIAFFLLVFGFARYKRWVGSTMMSKDGTGMTIAEVAFLNTPHKTARSFFTNGMIAFAWRILIGAAPIIFCLVTDLGGALFPILAIYFTFIYTWLILSYFKVPVKYAKRKVGTKEYGGQSLYLSLKLMMSGVMPIIFASAILLFPYSLLSLGANQNGNGYIQFILLALSPGSWVYAITFGILIIAFSVFYTKIIFNSQEVSDNLKRHGGFIPGIKPGSSTVLFINQIVTKMSLMGGIVLAVYTAGIDPIMSETGIPFYFGGTSLFIIIGVTLDLINQIQSHLMANQYDGFMQKQNREVESPPPNSGYSRNLVGCIILISLFIPVAILSRPDLASSPDTHFNVIPNIGNLK